MGAVPRPLRVTPPSASAAAAFVRDILGETLWAKQLEILCSVFGPRRVTAVRSCHGAGKTKAAAIASLAWLYTGPYRQVITTAPTWRQVRELLWKEIRVAHRRAELRGFPLGGVLPPSDPSLRIDEGWLAIGFSSDDPVNVQGWHSAGGILVVLDEAPGVNAAIWEALQGVIVGAEDRVLAIGNPTSPSGPFYDLFQDPEKHDAACISISAYDTPNVREGREVIPGLVTREWVEARLKDWGRDSPIFKVRVLGEFPDNADDALVPMSWVDAAQRRWGEVERAAAWAPPYWLGVDVARYGADSTVLASCCDRGVRSLRRLPKLDTVQTMAWVTRVLRDNPGIQQVRVDADGLGAGVFDALREHFGADRAVEIRGGLAARDATRYANRRAEWFWNLRERLDPSGEAPIALPPDDSLRAQLTGMRWSMTPRGQVRIETKEEMRARGMKSPDEADAAAYGMSAASIGERGVYASVDAEVHRVENPWAF